MKKYIIAMALLASFPFFAEAQKNPAPAARQAPAAAKGDAKDLQALKDLNDKERAELQAVNDAAKPGAQKYQDQIKALEVQIKALNDKYRADMEAAAARLFAVRAKYAPEKYALMDRINPGSGLHLSQYDKAINELEKQWKLDLGAINAAENAELARSGPAKETSSKYQAQRKALAEVYTAKREKLQAMLRGVPAK